MEWETRQIKEGLRAVADIMLERKDFLIELDSVVGDGDLGLTMSDGFRAAAETAEASNETDIGKLLYLSGKAMASAVPSSMGTLMSAGLINAGKMLKGTAKAGNREIALLIRGWYDGVEKLGKAKPGEKTFLDGLLPAVELMERGVGEDDYASIIVQAFHAAEMGAQSTVGMLAVHGRAAIRGEASRRLLDPGAVVASLVMKAMAQMAMEGSYQP